MLLFICCTAFVKSNFYYGDFNETTGLVFMGSAGTTSCRDNELLKYGDVQGKADQFNENVVKEIGETTDEVSTSSVETHQQIYNAEIEASQAGFLHRPGTLSAPVGCAVRARLTPSGPSKAGAVWFRSEVPVSNGFDTYFTFQITDHSKECSVHKDQYFTQFSYRTCSVHGGDGFAFVIHNADSSRYKGEYQLGQNGGQMGFGGIPNSIAVAFDTWQNPGQDTIGVDHVSIQSLGQNPNDALEAGLLGVPRYHEIADGVIHTARIKYFPELKPEYLDKLVASDSLIPYLLDNGEQKRVGTLVVYMDKGIETDTPLLAMPINLSLLIKMPSDKAFVGFTASTGRFYEKHDIISWRWCDEEPCTWPVPSDFDTHQTSELDQSVKRSFTPGPGYGGGTAKGFPSKNQNPNTDPWFQSQEHFASGRAFNLAPDANSQVPPATDY